MSNDFNAVHMTVINYPTHPYEDEVTLFDLHEI